MSQENVELMIPFDSLVVCIEKLGIEDKIRLLELLEEQLDDLPDNICDRIILKLIISRICLNIKC